MFDKDKTNFHTDIEIMSIPIKY